MSLAEPRESHRSTEDQPSSTLLAAPWNYIIAAAITALCFVADIILPRGATAAIGYCLVPVVAASGRSGFFLGMTVLCTAFTVSGYFSEQTGASAWVSVFDRSMVVGVVWLTFWLAKRRVAYLRALRAATNELRRSNADLERFASTAAHDLRGPLGSVGLLAQLLHLSNSVKADSEATELVESIKSELQRMSGLIQSLLTYGRAGSHQLELTDCDCSAVLARVKQSLKSQIDSHSARIVNDPLPTICADPVLIAQLFQNLIENSIRYRGDAPPKIHISAVEQPNGSWLFSEHDNGIGLRPEDCERIFEPFSQIQKENSSTGGIGLGLATCKRIVERHGGRIWAESTPGEGATFRFTLPSQAGRPCPPQSHAGPPSQVLRL